MSKPTKFEHEMSTFHLAGYQAVYTQTFEQPALLNSIKNVAASRDESVALGENAEDPTTVITWSPISQFTVTNLEGPYADELITQLTPGHESRAEGPSERFCKAVDRICAVAKNNTNLIFVLEDADALLTSRPEHQINVLKLANAINNMAVSFTELGGVVHRNLIVIASHRGDVPADLKHLIPRLDFPMPTVEELAEIISGVVNMPADSELVLKMAQICAGLSRRDTADAIARTFVDHPDYGDAALEELKRIKAAAIGQNPGLQYLEESRIPPLANIRGFDNAVAGISAAMQCMTPIGREVGLGKPPTIAMVGPPGCGKSMCAKLISRIAAQVCGYPVPTFWLRLDTVRGKFVGETENNLERALAIVEGCRGAILIIDECEKMLSGFGAGAGAESSGTDQRVGARLLSWLEEERKHTAIVATFNSVGALPPEFFSRFSNLFGADLPDDQSRKEIFEVHWGEYRLSRGFSDAELDSQNINMEGFSGRDIATVVKKLAEVAMREGRFDAAERRLLVTAADLSEVVKECQQTCCTKLFSKVIAASREWTKDHAVQVMKSRVSARIVNQRGKTARIQRPAILESN